MRNATIISAARYLPPQKVSSNDLMLEFGCSDYDVMPKYLEKLTGVKERRWADSSIEPGDLAIKASELAIKKAKINARELDMIIFCGMEGNKVEPTTAHIVQDELGGKDRCECFDVTNACHGFMTGLKDANRAVKSGECDNVLVCTGETSGRRNHAIFKLLKEKNLSKVDFLKLMGYFSLGDAGGAVVVSAAKGKKGFQHFLTESGGRFADYCYYDYDKSGLFDGQMIMSKTSSLFAEYISKLVPEFYQTMNWDINKMDSHVDYLISHQIGKAPHQELIDLTGVPREKAIDSFAMYGNLTSATMPFNLSDIELGKDKSIFGLVAGSGASMSLMALTA